MNHDSQDDEATTAPPRESADSPTDNDARAVRSPIKYVSTVRGDRMCARCGYNLCGQPVAREPHYDMLMIRCPECGTVASIEEYPLFSRWLNRWAILLAAVWFGVLMLAVFGTGRFFFNVVPGVQSYNVPELTEVMESQHWTWVRGQPQAWFDKQPGIERTEDGTILMPWAGGSGPIDTAWIIKDWWLGQDKRQFFVTGGGWRMILGTESYRESLIWAPVVFLIGGICSIVLLSRRRATAIIPLILSLLVCYALFHKQVTHYSAEVSWLGGVWSQSWNTAYEVTALPHLLATMAWLIPTFLLGAWLGRPFIRAIVLALLPPRKRGALAFLWTLDGKQPPGRCWFETRPPGRDDGGSDP